MRKIVHTFRMAFKDARKNLLHTLLSVLGIVIGVGALVSILSLIDGMEKYAHEQISKTTSLESVVISTKRRKKIDNVWVTKKEYGYMDYQRFNKLLEEVSDINGYIRYRESGFINVNDTTERGVMFSGIADAWNDQLTQLSGEFISKEDLERKDTQVVISRQLAVALGVEDDYAVLLGDSIGFKDKVYTIKGVVDTPGDNLQIFAPITLIEDHKIRSNPPDILLMVSSVEKVLEVKIRVQDFLKQEYGDLSADFDIATNEMRVEQANKGFLVFRLVMGLIVGISVLVGGIGVMNVLLISVTERTAEIGVRKAVGAKRRDIVMQFLSESLSVSFIGSFLGLLLGILFTLAAVPIIKHATEMPFEAAYTWETLLTIMIVSIVVGIVFGTYPAMKASRLDPVEAIRRE